MSALLIECGQEQNIAAPRLNQSSDGDRSTTHHADRFGPSAKEPTAHRNIISNSPASSLSAEDKGMDGEEGMISTTVLRHESGQARRRSESSTQINMTQSTEGWSASRGRRRESGAESHSTPTYIYGAGASEHSKKNSNLPPQQYTTVWYCHINCHQPGPWRSEITRCLGCEHDRCDKCKEETVVTRDPSPPRG